MAVTAIIQQKGGSGKTTTVVNLAAVLVQAGKRVLIVDIDPQGNAGTALGLQPRKLQNTIYQVLWGKVPAHQAIIKTDHGIDVLPANNHLWFLAGEMPKHVGEVPEFRDPDLLLKRRLVHLASEYDEILIDTPPSLDYQVRGALAWADQALITLQTEFLALDAAVDLLETLDLVTHPKGLNPKLKVLGVAAVMHQGRTNLAIQVLEDAKRLYRRYGIPFFATAITRTIRFGEAPAIGVPAVMATDEAAVTAYYDLAEEVFGVVVAQRKEGRSLA